MADGSRAYNRYFGRLNTGKIKIRGVMARKGDTPEYVNKNAAGSLRGTGRSESRLSYSGDVLRLRLYRLI
jgi:hypothetical protein